MSHKLKNSSKNLTSSNTPRISYNALFGILIITFLVFINSLTPNFVSLDDPEYIRNNPYIKSLSLESIWKMFTVFYNANYHPITTLSYAIEFKLFGLKATGYHFTNLIIHLVNVTLVFFLTHKLSKRNEIAIVCALLFAIHPMHVESVSWISERKDLLYALFYLGGLFYYLEYIQKKIRKYLYLTILFFLLSLLSKSAAVTFSLVLCVFDFYFKRGLNKHIVSEKIPFFILSIIFGVIAIFSQDAANAINADLMPKYSLVERFFVVCYATCYYLFKLFVPINLSAIHYAPKVLPYYYYLSPLAIGIISWVVIRTKIIQRELLFGLLLYIFSISLTLQIIPIGYSITSERYSYIPYIGIFFILGNLYTKIVDGKILPHSRTYIKYIFSLFVICCLFLTYQRNKIWKNSIALFTDLVQKFPEVAHAHFSLGKVFQYESNNLSRALAAFNRSIELDSTDAEVYFCRGNVYHAQQKYSEALVNFKKATELDSLYTQAFYNIGICYIDMNLFEEGLEPLTASIRLEPHISSYQARAKCYFYLKRYKEAIQDYSDALKLDPNLSEALSNRGVCYLNLNQTEAACKDWKTSANMGFTKAAEFITFYCK